MPLGISPPTTDIEVQSQAAILCGKNGFNTIEPGNSFAQNAKALYGTLVSAELGSNRWRFALEEQETGTLTTLSGLEQEIWNYYWDLPADLIMLHKVKPFVPYTIRGRQMLTTGNQSLAVIYSKNVPVTKWPPAFSLYIVYALADMLAMSVTLSDRMVARIKENLKTWHSRALFADSQQEPSKGVRDKPYLSVRHGYSSRRGR